MRRGDFVTIAMQGDFGKPRPALVIQTDHFNQHPSVTVLPVTGMVDKAITVKRDKVGPPIGRISADALLEVERCLAVFLGITK